jgi:hypothetical protein
MSIAGRWERSNAPVEGLPQQAPYKPAHYASDLSILSGNTNHESLLCNDPSRFLHLPDPRIGSM